MSTGTYNRKFNKLKFNVMKYNLNQVPFITVQDILVVNILRPCAVCCRDFLQQLVTFFGQSLTYGNQYIYQSMPRMLTLWLDFGSEVVECEKKVNEVMLQGLRSMLNQLNKVSRICLIKYSIYSVIIVHTIKLTDNRGQRTKHINLIFIHLPNICVRCH